MQHFKINKTKVGYKYPTYFIADIAANHDGDLKKAIALIHAAKEAGANAAKFQHFNANTIVSDKSFVSFVKKISHQSKWKKSVHEVYSDASINLDWTKTLYKECKKLGIDFFTSPYSTDLVDHVNQYVQAYKIGSGDITYTDIIKYIAKKKKPIILATGASNLKDVERAIKCVKRYNKNICLMQCNTNYTASLENFKYINLNVLLKFKQIFKNVVLGLSDHTPGHATVLGAITLGARVIEKHLTLSNKLEGPDHKFSMTPKTWRDMVDRSRELEHSLGTQIKKIEKNELETVIVQRRSLHLLKNLKKNQKINIKKDIIALRPSPNGAVQPYEASKIKFKKLKKDKFKGDLIFWKDLK
jgi:sialic acid synthase SpsE